MGDRDDHPGRGGHGGGGRGGHGQGKGGDHDGSHREELRSDLTDVHHARDALKDADTAQEKKQARQDLQEAQGELKKDWGPGMPKGAGEAHHGGGRKDDDDDNDGRKKHGGGHGGRKDND